MCGRFDRHRPVAEFGDVINGLDFSDDDPVVPSYNVAPSQRAAVVCRTDAGVRLLDLTWGLVPTWLKREGFSKPINARAETLADKPMFRDAFRKTRCLVLCDGYYEWRSEKPVSSSLITLQPPTVILSLWLVFGPKTRILIRQ